MTAQELRHDEHEVGRRRALGQVAGQAHADHLGHRLVERLAEQDRLGLDAADAVAQDAEGVDHRRVRIGPDERVRERHAVALVDDRRQELEVDLVDDAGPGRDDPEVPERGLRPAEELIALDVALVLALDIEGERAGRPELVDLDRVVDDEVGLDERVDPCRIAAEIGHRVTHRGEVDDRGDAGQVLEDDPRRHERDLGLRRDPGPPCGQRLDVLRADDAATRVAQQVLEQDPDRDRGGRQVHPIGQDGQPIVIREAGAERRPGAEGVIRRQPRPSSLARVHSTRASVPRPTP